SVNVSNFITVKLSQSSYYLWKEMAIGLAENQGLLGHLTGETPAPQEFILPPEGAAQNPLQQNPEFTNWRTNDLRSWLLGTISED
ncbi:hypothetical protein M569_16830, partial [Genlisea aurea]